MPRALTICRIFWLCMLPGSLLAQTTPETIADQLSTRYAPYADGVSMPELESLTDQSADIWWRTPEAIRSARGTDALPLEGLHLALDPGHVGGIWAEWEGRHFRIQESDYWVREGELVLEVAQRVRTRLVELGAQVSLLRESAEPVNPKQPADYWAQAAAELTPSDTLSLLEIFDLARTIRARAVRMSVVIGELAERARLVNEVIRPDALISLHINAAPWPQGERRLVESDHAHVLVFGCLSAKELASPGQRAQMLKKMTNGSSDIEATLGAAFGRAFAEATSLPASEYDGRNAIRIDPEVPYLWARNLMLLRLVDCPTVLLEPYIANSQSSYSRIQAALAARAAQSPLPPDDILLEYTDAVVTAVLSTYGPAM
jgi:N-acetylmuramoyl-L-alanine amidase